MPVNEKYIHDFAEDEYMHLICKTVGNTPLFQNEANRIFFMKRYAQYSTGYFDTLSYILMENHVHWLVKCQSASCLKDHLCQIPCDFLKSHQRKFLDGEMQFTQAIEFQCKDFFISYSMAYNKMFNRSGSLFVNPFRRIAINNQEHLIQLIIYIHANVLKHGIKKDFTAYKWSSYASILSDKPTLLSREQVLDLFGGREAFVNIHKQQSDYYYSHVLSME